MGATTGESALVVIVERDKEEQGYINGLDVFTDRDAARAFCPEAFDVDHPSFDWFDAADRTGREELIDRMRACLTEISAIEMRARLTPGKEVMIPWHALASIKARIEKFEAGS